jgi:alpha-tubulin suppressor-like RCC1 family protein
VSAGAAHTCALDSTGAVRCWGSNESGQLGDDALDDSPVPVAVVRLSDAVAISAGQAHSCALESSGRLECWGDDSQGELGDGFRGGSRVPVDVVANTAGSLAVAAGVSFTCAITPAAGVQCWGNDHTGQLGNNATTLSPIPVDVVGLPSTVAAIAARGGTCAILSGGALMCWGYNFYGQVGDGSTVDRDVPVRVQGLSTTVRAVATGYTHTCAITAAGGVKCWGSNVAGALGLASGSGVTTPVDVAGLTSGVRAIAAGGSFTCALTDAGAVKCWGDNSQGQLGNGVVNSAAPVDVTGLGSGVVAVAAGYAHACAIDIRGDVECWGANGNGQIGTADPGPARVPIKVQGL